MFKCKECGTEYKEKPDFCDCGNDEFEEVAEENVKSVTNSSVVENNTEAVNKISQENQTKHIQSSSGFSQYRTQTEDAKNRYYTPVEPYSLVIFVVCILLSLYVIFFAWNSKENDVTVKPKEEVKVASNIPSVDKFWNNTPPVRKSDAIKQETPSLVEKNVNVVNETVKTAEPKLVAPQKVVPQSEKKQVTVQKTAQPKVTVVPLKKTVQTKLSQPAAQTQRQNTQTQVNKTVSTANAKQKLEQERKAAEEAQIKKLQAEQAKKQAEEKARQAKLSSQEFASYKVQLRNTIGRKIDFTRVIGDGSCTVSFKIDANGKLINRAFAKQSSNYTLNDAVYSAVMSTPTFNPPPAAYKNETLNLNIRFYNGNFEISLP